MNQFLKKIVTQVFYIEGHLDVFPADNDSSITNSIAHLNILCSYCVSNVEQLSLVLEAMLPFFKV